MTSGCERGATDQLDAVTGEPVEDLKEQQADEQQHERAVKLVLEDRQCEQRLRDGEPAALLQPL